MLSSESPSLATTLKVDDGCTLSINILNPLAHGVPLVMIAGLSSLPTDLGSLPNDLAASDRPVITFANRGLGESELPEGVDPRAVISLERMARDTYAVAKHALTLIDAKRKEASEQTVELNHAFDLFGHSMGGFISLTLSFLLLDNLIPDATLTIRRLVLACTSSETPESELMSQIGFREGETKEMMIERLMTFNLDDKFKEEYPEKFKSICENYLKGKRPVNVIIAQAIATSTYDVTSRLSLLSHLPVLIIHGVIDKVVPIELGDILGKGIPKALYLRMENVGHLAMAYAGDAFAGIVDGFLVRGRRGDGGDVRKAATKL